MVYFGYGVMLAVKDGVIFLFLLWCRVGRERQSEMTNGRRWVSSFDREIGEDICHAFLDGQVQITTTPDGTGQSDQHDPISV